ncbi:creatininase family protein [Beijerinckia mobilis]|uniref:creatininase family protein n=1 Tax=Beijerinckia mobilis TaxID=231434 RepID=UPI00068B9FF2|nr:creatininase family protein [Beijerinckia mobilis]
MHGPDEIRWERLKPAEFIARRDACPIVYLPMGLCEPHGHVAPFGLDTIKAEWLCMEAARRFGGVVAPTQSWHIHECGYHAPWLQEVMGGVNPLLAALPAHLVLETLLYQLRAFRNAGFKAAVVISGHNGAQDDLRMVARHFSTAFPFEHFIASDPELVDGLFQGDHAGRYEISQLLAISGELVALGRADRINTDALGRFAQNPDAVEATVEEGQSILDASLEHIGQVVRAFHLAAKQPTDFIPMNALIPIWRAIDADRVHWCTTDLSPSDTASPQIL